MRISQARIVGAGPVGDLTFPFTDEDGAVRRVVVLLGGGGVGRTSVLAAIASTRPGYAVALPRQRGAAIVPHAMTEWVLGDDDAARPHPLRVTSPNAPVTAPPREDEAAARREQALFDRRATEGGFAFLALPSGRWFSRAPVLLSAPERTLGRYDVRAAATFDDATRADLARETKATLAYARIAGALGRNGPGSGAAEQLERAMVDAVEPLARLAGVRFTGVDIGTLEPLFEQRESGARVTFDDLPTHARNLIAFAALPLRLLFAAYPGRDPRASEGVVAIDDVELHQDPAVQRGLVPALREALPNVQWLLTTRSPLVTLACAPGEVLALRRMPDSRQVELYEGEQALVH